MPAFRFIWRSVFVAWDSACRGFGTRDEVEADDLASRGWFSLFTLVSRWKGERESDNLGQQRGSRLGPT